MSPVQFGVDVSKWQGPDIDWEKVATTVQFAICRATIGTDFDATYDRNARAARSAGLVTGAYHYLMPASVVPPRQQAEAFLRQIGSATGLLTVVDVEYHSPEGKVGLADVNSFAARFHELAGPHPLIVYTGGWYWRSYVRLPGDHIGPLWESHWVRSGRDDGPAEVYARVPASYWTPGYGGWERATILQFGGSRVPGIGGKVDTNAFRGSLAALRALTGEEPEEPEMLNFDYVNTASGTVTVKGAGHSIIRVSDGAHVSVADGLVKAALARVTVTDPARGWSNVPGFAVQHNAAPHVLLEQDVTYAPIPTDPERIAELEQQLAAAADSLTKAESRIQAARSALG